MNLLATIQEPRVSRKKIQGLPERYHHRKAARAVVLDSDGSVALLHVSKFGYHKLPGGGVEENEDLVIEGDKRRYFFANPKMCLAHRFRLVQVYP